MTIRIEEGMKYAGRVTANITDFKEEDIEKMGIELLKEIARLAGDGDFSISIDVFQKIRIGQGV